MRIPSRAIRIHHHHGIYYCYDGIYYRPWGSYYVVCRPPYETWLEREYYHNLEMDRIRFNYYYEQAQRYDALYASNNQYINEQYQIIAQNNELIAQQNAILAQQNAAAATSNESSRLTAAEAYASANGLGLIQSYANANAEYYYQDGVFYLAGADGKYQVIIPPTGALVEYLPEDYEVVTLKDGNQYYKVDDTVYKVTVKDGVPYFEVMGQLYE